MTWRDYGVTVGFASAPPPCSGSNLYMGAWYGMRLWGQPWHTTRGVRVGQTVAEVRKRYPNARFQRGSDPALLILVQQRDQEFVFVKLAVTINRFGRVSSIEVPAAYIY